MKDEDITRLNELISDLNTTEIMSHIADETLEKWLEILKMEFSMVSISLYTRLHSKSRISEVVQCNTK